MSWPNPPAALAEELATARLWPKCPAALLLLGFVALLGCGDSSGHGKPERSDPAQAFARLIAQYRSQESQEWDFSSLIVTPDALAQLERVSAPGVRTLRFARARADQPPRLTFLRNFPQLEELYLGQLPVDDRALEQISRLTRLRVLNAERVQASRRGMESLVRLKRLELLRICRARLGAEELEPLTRIKSLRALILDGVPLDDAAVEVLKRLRQLESLYVYRSGLGQQRLIELQEVVPHVHW